MKFTFFPILIYFLQTSLIFAQAKGDRNGIVVIQSLDHQSKIMCSIVAINKVFDLKLNKNELSDVYFSTSVITQDIWMRHMKFNNSSSPGPLLPVDQVSFSEAEEFCKRLTVSARQKGDIDDGWYFTLPKITEWDFYAKANQTQDNMPLSKVQPFVDVLNIPESRRHNSWGIYACFGPVAQWCYDDVDLLKNNNLAAAKGLIYNKKQSESEFLIPHIFNKSDHPKGVGVRVVLKRGAARKPTATTHEPTNTGTNDANSKK